MSSTEQTSTQNVDATINSFLEQLAAQGGPPIYTLSPTAARAVLTAVPAGNVPKPEADIEDSTISGGPWLTRQAMGWFWDSYAPDAAVRNEPTASPLQASLAQLQGLPPALMFTDENDGQRDDGEAYAH
jgi:acetyl esterase